MDVVIGNFVLDVCLGWRREVSCRFTYRQIAQRCRPFEIPKQRGHHVKAIWVQGTKVRFGPSHACLPSLLPPNAVHGVVIHRFLLDSVSSTPTWKSLLFPQPQTPSISKSGHFDLCHKQGSSSQQEFDLIRLSPKWILTIKVFPTQTSRHGPDLTKWTTTASFTSSVRGATLQMPCRLLDATKRSVSERYIWLARPQDADLPFT